MMMMMMMVLLYQWVVQLLSRECANNNFELVDIILYEDEAVLELGSWLPLLCLEVRGGFILLLR